MRQKRVHSSTSINRATRGARLNFRESTLETSTKLSRQYLESTRTQPARRRSMCTSDTLKWPSTLQCSSQPWFYSSWSFVAVGALRALNGKRTKGRTTSLDTTMARITSTLTITGRRSPTSRSNWSHRSHQSHFTSTFVTPSSGKIQNWSDDSTLN